MSHLCVFAPLGEDLGCKPRIQNHLGGFASKADEKSGLTEMIVKVIREASFRKDRESPEQMNLRLVISSKSMDLLEIYSNAEMSLALMGKWPRNGWRPRASA